MISLLKQYLIDRVSPEYLDELEKATNFFDEFGVEDYESQFEELVMGNLNQISEDNIDPIIALFKNIQVYILKEHSVIPEDTATVVDLNQLIQAIVNIQNYDDSETILNICNSDDNSEAIFSDLVEITSGIPSDNILVSLESVGVELIKVIQQLHSGVVVTESDNDIALAKVAFTRKEKLKTLVSIEGCDISIFMQAVKDGIVPDLSFKDYIPYYKEAINKVTPDHMVFELFAFAFYSLDGLNSAKDTIYQNLELIIDNFVTINRLNTKIVRLNMEIIQNEQKGILPRSPEE